MKYITIIFLIYAFLKTWNYGIFELKENKNKTAAIATFFLAIVRLNFSFSNFNNYVLVLVLVLILLVVEVVEVLVVLLVLLFPYKLLKSFFTFCSIAFA